MRENQINLLEMECIMIKKSFGTFQKYSEKYSKQSLSIEILIEKKLETSAEITLWLYNMSFLILKSLGALVIWTEWVDFYPEMMDQQK